MSGKTPVPLADSTEIGRLAGMQPFQIMSALVTIQAHCVAILDTLPPDHVTELTGCISQNCLELAKALKAEKIWRGHVEGG